MIVAVVDTAIMNYTFLLSQVWFSLDCCWDPSDSWTFFSDHHSIMWNPGYPVQYAQLTVSKVYV